MGIKKVLIHNFKSFRDRTFIFNKGLNIVVGNNETGKSTLIEAIHLALSGYYLGRNVRNDFSKYLFNIDCVREYEESVKNVNPICLPELSIEVFFDDDASADFQGDQNSDKDNSAKGFVFKVAFNDVYKEEYEELLESKTEFGFPIEYYDASWESFARGDITPRKIPLKSSLINTSDSSGKDLFTPKIIQEKFNAADSVKIAQAYRKMVTEFSQKIGYINEKYSETTLFQQKINLSVANDYKNDWENSLVSEVEHIPFPHVGQGMQCIAKTNIVLQHKKTHNSDVILIEEPESHLSFSWLNKLINLVETTCKDKQVFITTHSSFVANKLGLEHIILLGNNNESLFRTFITQSNFFRKVAGYDTLRFILCDKAILVEGPSDELIVKKAYMISHQGREPIYDGIDVISVGLSFLHFLEIAKNLKIKVCVVTDNDGDIDAIEKKYKDYLDAKYNNIKICYDTIIDSGSLKDFNYNTLEPKIVKANKNNISLFNRVFSSDFKSVDDLLQYMHSHKTECALKIFDSTDTVMFPKYITDAFNNE